MVRLSPVFFRQHFDFGLRRRGLRLTHNMADHRLGRARAGIPGAAHGAANGLVHRLAGEEHAVPDRLHQNATRSLAARRRRRECAERPGILLPLRRLRALQRLLHAGAKHTAQRFHGKLGHRLVALLGEVAAKFASDLDHRKRRASDIGKQTCGAQPRRFLDHQIVALQAERIALELQRDVVEAAELEPFERVLVALGQAAVELHAVQYRVG